MDATSPPRVIAQRLRRRFGKHRRCGGGFRAPVPECQRSGSTLRSWKRFFFLLILCLTTHAHSQSRALLEAVRLHRHDARTLAEDELNACRKKRCASLERLSLLTGYLALSEGDAEGAVRQLRKVSAPSGLEAFHRFYLGQAYFYAGEPERALGPLEASLKRAPASLRPRALARFGEAALRAEAHARAGPALEEATNLLKLPELFWQRSLVRQALGNLEGALADARVVAVRFPTHGYASPALALLATAGPDKAFTLEERLRRAQLFLESSDAKSALAELETLEREKLARGEAAEARVALTHAQTLFELGRSDEGMKALEQAMKGHADIASQAAYLRARRAMRADDNEGARKLMEAVAEKYPKESAAQEALYYAGWLELRAKRYEEAAARFDSFVARYPRGRKTDEAMWFKALALFRAGQFSNARAAFDGIVARFPRSSLVPQARYWGTRALQLGGGPDAEVASGYESLLKNHVGSFYATLALTRLQAMGRPAQLPIPRHSPVKRPRVPPELAVAERLAETGLFTDLGEELELASRSARSSEKALQMGLTLDSWGEHGAAYHLAVRRLWGEAFNKLDASSLSLLYPRAFRQAVEAAAEKEGVDPYFIWSIMRRESNFRPEVMSAANARGLMQLIPPTAAAIAREMGVPPPDPDALFAPDVNIRFATWYLSKLFARFSHPVLVAGAYNAGPPRASAWSSGAGKVELDLFVEEIPFKETRAYVKQVMADHFIYHAMYGDGSKSPRLQLDVPVAGSGVDF